MKLLTTESQRHREIKNQRDPRTAAVIGAAIEVNFKVPLLTRGIIRRVL
jgi:hypothetical protein